MRIQLLSMIFVGSLLGMEETEVQNVFTTLMRSIQKPPQVRIVLVNEKDREKQREQWLQQQQAEEEKKYLQKMTTYTLWKRKKKSNI